MDAVDRMFQLLVRALRSEQPPADGMPFSAADLHDRILPYRHFRRELALENNREYELTLMQLLSGARGYLDVDERLRDVIRRELAQPTPDPARLRDVADAQASVNPVQKAQVAEGRASGPARAGITECPYCGGSLPDTRTAQYCPHCGQNLDVVNCAACGAELDADWRYCVVCGKAAPEARK